LVLDSSVVVSAFRSRLGASARVMELVVEERIVPLATVVLEAAVNGRADALVTHNVADFAAAARGLD
jgi:predicted nucleic acid-binding protein